MTRRCLFCALWIALPAAVLSQTAPSVDDLVAKNTAARGGIEKIKAIQSLKITGKAVMANGMEAPLTLYVKRPGLNRIEMSLQGKTLVQSFDGTESWMINPFAGSDEPRKAGEEENKRARENADMMLDGHLIDYKTKGHTVELAGKEDVEGSPAYKLKLTTKDGNVIYSYLDAENYLDVKTQTRIKQMGQEVDVESYLGSYKSVAGVMMPHALDQKMNGKPLLKMVFDKVETNVSLDETLFKFPAKSNAKPEEKKP